MHHKTLFTSFNTKNTTTGKKRVKEQKYQKGRRKLEIILGDIVCYTKTENHKEQYTNKKGDKELKLKCLRTA